MTLPTDTRAPRVRALVLVPQRKGFDRGGASERDPEFRRAEAVGLAQAIQLDVVESACLAPHDPVPATLLGKGQVEQWATRIGDSSIGLVVVDHPLTPVQQRNLEKAWACKVLDRTGLILEIFGARARTREGQMQVELAALDYQKSRLVRSWTHLERQRGGFGFMGGPGESQLEIDRRLITDRIVRLKEDLEKVRRTRALQREARHRAEHPTVALVGYTNAGKSTLFNHLTGADALAKDMLFATLDPSLRGLKLPSGREVVLSDTVGFISDLPTHLVEAFRATLEEVQLADVILHVRDVAHPEARDQKEAVERILADLGIAPDDPRRIDVLNKADLLPPEDRARFRAAAERTSWEARHHLPLEGLKTEAGGGTVLVSALTGEGLDDLLALLEAKLSERRKTCSFAIPLEDGAALAWLYQHGQVLEREDKRGHARLRIALEPSDLGRFRRRFPGHAPEDGKAGKA